MDTFLCFGIDFMDVGSTQELAGVDDSSTQELAGVDDSSKLRMVPMNDKCNQW